MKGRLPIFTKRRNFKVFSGYMTKEIMESIVLINNNFFAPRHEKFFDVNSPYEFKQVISFFDENIKGCDEKAQVNYPSFLITSFISCIEHEPGKGEKQLPLTILNDLLSSPYFKINSVLKSNNTKIDGKAIMHLVIDRHATADKYKDRYKEALKILLAHKDGSIALDFTSYGIERYKPLYFAIMNGDKEVLKLLSEHKVTYSVNHRELGRITDSYDLETLKIIVKFSHKEPPTSIINDMLVVGNTRFILALHDTYSHLVVKELKPYQSLFNIEYFRQIDPYLDDINFLKEIGYINNVLEILIDKLPELLPKADEYHSKILEYIDQRCIDFGEARSNYDSFKESYISTLDKLLQSLLSSPRNEKIDNIINLILKSPHFKNETHLDFLEQILDANKNRKEKSDMIIQLLEYSSFLNLDESKELNFNDTFGTVMRSLISYCIDIEDENFANNFFKLPNILRLIQQPIFSGKYLIEIIDHKSQEHFLLQHGAKGPITPKQLGKLYEINIEVKGDFSKILQSADIDTEEKGFKFIRYAAEKWGIRGNSFEFLEKLCDLNIKNDLSYDELKKLCDSKCSQKLLNKVIRLNTNLYGKNPLELSMAEKAMFDVDGNPQLLAALYNANVNIDRGLAVLGPDGVIKLIKQQSKNIKIGKSLLLDKLQEFNNDQRLLTMHFCDLVVQILRSVRNKDEFKQTEETLAVIKMMQSSDDFKERLFDLIKSVRNVSTFLFRESFEPESQLYAIWTSPRHPGGKKPATDTGMLKKVSQEDNQNIVFDNSGDNKKRYQDGVVNRINEFKKLLIPIESKKITTEHQGLPSGVLDVKNIPIQSYGFDKLNVIENSLTINNAFDVAAIFENVKELFYKSAKDNGDLRYTVALAGKYRLEKLKACLQADPTQSSKYRSLCAAISYAINKMNDHFERLCMDISEDKLSPKMIKNIIEIIPDFPQRMLDHLKTKGVDKELGFLQYALLNENSFSHVFSGIGPKGMREIAYKRLLELEKQQIKKTTDSKHLTSVTPSEALLGLASSRFRIEKLTNHLKYLYNKYDLGLSPERRIKEHARLAYKKQVCEFALEIINTGNIPSELKENRDCTIENLLSVLTNRYSRNVLKKGFLLSFLDNDLKKDLEELCSIFKDKIMVAQQRELPIPSAPPENVTPESVSVVTSSSIEVPMPIPTAPLASYKDEAQMPIATAPAASYLVNGEVEDTTNDEVKVTLRDLSSTSALAVPQMTNSSSSLSSSSSLTSSLSSSSSILSDLSSAPIIYVPSIFSKVKLEEKQKREEVEIEIDPDQPGLLHPSLTPISDSLRVSTNTSTLFTVKEGDVNTTENTIEKQKTDEDTISEHAKAKNKKVKHQTDKLTKDNNVTKKKSIVC